MGVSGNFWELLKPYARYEGLDFLRDKRVAVDLSFWIVQHDAAIRSRLPAARNPHLRTTFFRTVSLFSKMGAYPVFVLDGDPSPLKSQARIERFLRSSGLDPSHFAKSEAEKDETENPVKRNRVFTRYIRESVELLELLGMPILRARSEAEALCAQLNAEGYVDACVTADSDAFLFGANCVVKCLQSNSKEPFECYYLSDIESGLGLKRKQMVAIALLSGNDHDLHGIPGFGPDTALRLVKLFNEDQILDRLREIGKGDFTCIEGQNGKINIGSSSSTIERSPHCSNCGHPGSKRLHSKFACEYCKINGPDFCIEKSSGFKCTCPDCDNDRMIKEQRRKENWQIKMCEKIASVKNFPNEEIINLYLSDNHGDYQGSPSLSWDKPKVEQLIEFLNYHQKWDPSYIRQRIFPLLSTIYLREYDKNNNILLYDQYEFDSILRMKVRYGHPCYLVKWSRAGSGFISSSGGNGESEESWSDEVGSTDLLDEPDVPQVLMGDGLCFLLSDENMELVRSAFPNEVVRFQEEQRMKELKSRERKLSPSPSKNKLESSKSRGVQLSITEFYRLEKMVGGERKNGGDDEPNKNIGEIQNSKNSRKISSDLNKNLPKSVRRRLLFD